jgi:hypothetical protein
MNFFSIRKLLEKAQQALLIALAEAKFDKTENDVERKWLLYF